MKISVIITVYNLEKYIEESLKSVFNQTRQPDEKMTKNLRNSKKNFLRLMSLKLKVRDCRLI